jgi:hypothetical protein
MVSTMTKNGAGLAELRLMKSLTSSANMSAE